MEREGLFRFRASNRCRVGDSPVRRHRFSRPDRAHLTGRVVADSENEIDGRRAGSCKLVPTLASQVLCWEIHALEQLDSHRVHLASGKASRTESAEPTLTPVIEKRLGEDAPRRVARAQEQDVIDTIGVHLAQQLAAG